MMFCPKLLRYHRKELWPLLLVPLFLFLLWQGVVLIFRFQDTFALMPVLLPFCGGILGLVYSLSAVLYDFERLVSLSRSRRRTLRAVLGYLGVLWALYLLISLALVGADYGLNRVLLPLLRPGFAAEGASLYAAGLPWLALGPLLGMAAGFVVGAMIQRFGRRAGWVVWGVYMAAFLLRDQIPWGAVLGILPVLLAAGAALLALSCVSLLRCSVRS